MKGGKIVLILVVVIVLGWVVYSLVRASHTSTIVSDQLSDIAEPVTLPVSTEDTETTTVGSTTQNTMENTNNSYTTASGMKVTITKEGTGAEAKSGDSVSMNYTGKFADGTSFDSNVDPKFGHVQPFMFTLGAGQVIKGWDEGVAGMKVGEKRILVIPYTLAYGENGYGPIPPKAELTFDVELVAIQ